MKHLFSVFTAVFVILVFLISCGGSEGTGSGGTGDSGNTNTGSTGGIYGHVTDFATGEDVANANVQLRPGGDTTLTGSDGMFEFQNLTSGDYSITVSKAGYTDLIDDFVITVRDRLVRRDVQLKKESATLRIVDDAGNDISELDFGGEVDDVSRSFNIFNDSSAAIDWEIIKSAEWIKSISKESGNLGAGNTLGIIVNIDRSLLRDGENLTKLHVTSNNGNKQLTIKATNFDSCRNNPCGHGTCKSTGTDTYECKCEDGYEINAKNTCADIDECADPELNKCPEHSDCANEEGTFSCVCHEGYSGNNCVANKRTKACEDLPENAKWNKAEEIEQTWSGEEWTPSTQSTYNEEPSEKECRFKCNSGYIWEDNKCINKKTSKCTGLLENSHWNVVSKIEQNWNGQEWVPPLEGTYNEEPSSDECRFVCNTNYIWKGSSCEPESKTTACTGLPENAVWNIATSIVQTWNGVEWLPSSTGTYNEEESMSKCYFKCNANYTWKGATCEANTKIVECEGLPINATWTTSTSVSQTWNGLEWIPSNQAVIDTGENTDACKFRCNTNYTYKNSQCEADTKAAECTGLPTNAVWNSVSSITQTWNGEEWLPSPIGSYNETASTAECKFKCDTNYVWNNSKCELGKQIANCMGLPVNASWNSVSSIEQTWNGEEWQPSTTGTYNTAESTSECRFKCNTNYTWKNSKCEADTRTANCSGLPSTGASWNTVSSITQTWNGAEWLPSAAGTYNTTASTSECRYKCDTNYNWDSSLTKCEAATRTYTCTGKPENSSWNSVASYNQTWTGTAWDPADSTATYNTTASTTQCRFKCNTNYSWKNSKCEADTRTVNCTGLPATGASWNSVSTITQTWNGSSWQPTTTGSYNTAESTAECRFKCNTNYTWDNSTCKANTQLVNCEGLPENAVWNTASTITQTWSGTDWLPTKTGTYNEEPSTEECRFKCNNNLEFDGSQYCIIPTIIGNICTGQNKCYNANNTIITCPTSGNDFFGQDAQYADQGICLTHKFQIETYVGDDIVRDLNTGLMWQRSIPNYKEKYSWDNAVLYCNSLVYAGYRDWRLPTPHELLSIMDSSRTGEGSGPGSSLDTTYFLPNDGDTQTQGFWSSATCANNDDYAWLAVFSYWGDVRQWYKNGDDGSRVMCVR